MLKVDQIDSSVWVLSGSREWSYGVGVALADYVFKFIYCFTTWVFINLGLSTHKEAILLIALDSSVIVYFVCDATNILIITSFLHISTQLPNLIQTAQAAFLTCVFLNKRILMYSILTHCAIFLLKLLLLVLWLSSLLKRQPQHERHILLSCCDNCALVKFLYYAATAQSHDFYSYSKFHTWPTVATTIFCK